MEDWTSFLTWKSTNDRVVLDCLHQLHTRLCLKVALRHMMKQSSLQKPLTSPLLNSRVKRFWPSLLHHAQLVGEPGEPTGSRGGGSSGRDFPDPGLSGDVSEMDNVAYNIY